MVLTGLWEWLETQPISAEIGATWLFPFAESIHVLAATFVVGSILMLDLRLLGVAGRRYAVSRIAADVIPWTLSAFFVAVVTGVAMFITQASRYAGNPAFRVKMALLVLAVINMVVFHRWSKRDIARWDAAHRTPLAIRFAGGCSLALWIGIIMAGRWTGHLL